MVKPITIAVIEDDSTVREYLAERITAAMPATEVQLFSNGEQALRQLTAAPCTIALFDVQLPGMNGIECIRRLKMLQPQIQMMVLTVYDNAETIFEALKAGAISYLLKTTTPEQLVQAIQEVCEGGSPISSQIARKVIEAFARETQTNDFFQALSRREQDILAGLAKGYRYKEIATQHYISVETVRTHVRNIYEKLQVNSRAAALKKTGFI